MGSKISASVWFLCLKCFPWILRELNKLSSSLQTCLPVHVTATASHCFSDQGLIFFYFILFASVLQWKDTTP